MEPPTQERRKFARTPLRRVGCSWVGNMEFPELNIASVRAVAVFTDLVSQPKQLIDEDVAGAEIRH
eukprot:5778151-Amphidinium_carterae.1